MNEKPFYKSKKFLSAIGMTLLILVNRKIGLDLNPDDMKLILFVWLGFIGAQGVADIGKYTPKILQQKDENKK